MAGFTNDVMAAVNADFTGGHPVVGQITQNGQLFIGSAVAPFLQAGFLTSDDGSIAFTFGEGTIDMSARPVFAPNAVFNEFDDFISPLNLSVASPKLGFTAFTEFFSNAGTAQNPGICSCTALPTTVNGMYLPQKNSTPALVGSIAAGGGVLSINWVIQLSSLSSGGNKYRFSCGLADTSTLHSMLDSYVNAIYFQYSDSINSGLWTTNCTSASTTTTSNSIVAATTDFVNLGFVVNAAASSVTFTINGVAVAGAIVTNIPITAMVPFMLAVNLSGGLIPPLNADLFYASYVLTTPR